MSNVDYKVIAHVVKLRLLPVLPTLIGQYQTCNVPGRSIFDNLTFMRNNMEFDGAVLSIDQAGAFNNVDHQYMLSVLEKYGIPEHIRNYIRIMYSNIMVLVNVGGELVGPIQFQKGVKQGDPVASILYILAFEPFLRRAHQKMLDIKPSPFPESPETNISSYADDVNLFVSDTAQITAIEEELSLFGKFSGGRINKEKTILLLRGSWKSSVTNHNLNTVSDGIKVLGIWFGDLVDRNWSDLLQKFKLKLEFYKSKCLSFSLFSKVRILNMFLLPILWYVLKVLDPPKPFIAQVKTLIEEYIWGTRRHWVKNLFLYLPTSNGGLGVKDIEVQTLVMRIKDAMRVFTRKPNHYFMNEHITKVKNIVISNEVQKSRCYENLRIKLNIIAFRFWSLPESLLNTIGVRNRAIFPGLNTEMFTTNGLHTVNDVSNYDATTDTIPSFRKRKFGKCLAEFKKHLEYFRESSIITDHGEFRFTCTSLLYEGTELKDENIYAASFFAARSISTISRLDLGKMKGSKWEKLNLFLLSNSEKDVVWRLWHNSWLTFSLGTKMGIYSSADCPFCSVRKPDTMHSIFCVSTKPFWKAVWKLLAKMDIDIEDADKLNGVPDCPLGDLMVFVAHNTLYNRVLYTINSHKLDYDLVKKYKQKVYEKIYFDYISTGTSSKSYKKFLERWNDGVGVFEIFDNKIDIRI
jgi:hypothetical protein